MDVADVFEQNVICSLKEAFDAYASCITKDYTFVNFSVLSSSTQDQMHETGFLEIYL